MARSTLYNFGRAQRSGTVTSPTFALPATDGILRSTLDVLPNQRDQPSRVVEFYFEVQLTDGAAFQVVSAGRWQGNPDTVTMPTEEFPVMSGGLDLRNRPARWRAVVPSGTVNFGGTVEWLDYAEAEQRAQR
jgi:hypothetical protein